MHRAALRLLLCTAADTCSPDCLLPPLSLHPCSWSSPYDTKLVPMRFEKTKAGTGAQKQQLGKMGALKAKKASC